MASKLGLLALVAAVSAVASVRPAAAYSLQLEWNAPRDCPDVEALRLSVERLLGEPLLDGTAVRASAAVTEDEDGRFTLTLMIRTPDIEGTRSLRTDSCASALDVAAFGIALALNPELRVDTLPGSPAPGEPDPGGPALPPSTRAPPDVERSATPLQPMQAQPDTAAEPDTVTELNGMGVRGARHPPEIWLAAHGLLDASLMPSPALGLGVAAEVHILQWLRLGARPALFLPQDARLEGGAGGVFSLWSLEVYGCAAIGTVIALCPLFQYGVLHGEGRGVEPTLEQSSRIYAPGMTVLGSFPLSQVTMARVGVTGLLPLGRDVFVVREGRVHGIPPLSFQLSLGVAIRAF